LRSESHSQHIRSDTNIAVAKIGRSEHGFFRRGPTTFSASCSSCSV
jgi:hypothetical protein